MNDRIEATIKGFYGSGLGNKSLIGCRVSIPWYLKRDFPSDTYDIRIGSIIRVKKGSRMKGGKYVRRHVNWVYLEDIVVEEFDLD